MAFGNYHLKSGITIWILTLNRRSQGIAAVSGLNLFWVYPGIPEGIDACLSSKIPQTPVHMFAKLSHPCSNYKHILHDVPLKSPHPPFSKGGRGGINHTFLKMIK